jgi:hypothetical protein
MQHRHPSPLLPALLLALATSAALALPNNADTVYRQERAACLDNRGPQDRSTCLKEAGAARAEARRNRLDNGESPAQLRANALLRCQAVLDADRAACERMALGEGTRSGSVAEGAVLTQITTVSPGRPAMPATPAPR